MNLHKVVLDTNLYIDWINRGRREELMVGPGRVRYLSAVVQMELRIGARTLPGRRAVDQLIRGYRLADRVVAPDGSLFDEAGASLRKLREKGAEIRRASFVDDVLIALTARSLGATVITMDADFQTIARVVDFRLEVVAP